MTDFADESPGETAEHWCMYFRDSGEHSYNTNRRDQLVCSGCGERKRGKK